MLFFTHSTKKMAASEINKTILRQPTVKETVSVQSVNAFKHHSTLANSNPTLPFGVRVGKMITQSIFARFLAIASSTALSSFNKSSLRAGLFTPPDVVAIGFDANGWRREKIQRMCIEVFHILLSYVISAILEGNVRF